MGSIVIAGSTTILTHRLFTMVTTPNPEYNVPTVAATVFAKLLTDPRLAIPDAVQSEAAHITFTGSPTPFLPVPLKFTEAISAVKALEAAFAAAIARLRFPSLDPGAVVIDTDHAALYVFSAFTTTLNGKPALDRTASAHLRDTDIHDSGKHRYRQMATNIYKTKDGRFFHLHGSMDARPSQRMVGVDTERVEIDDPVEIRKIYGDAVGKWDANDIDRAANEEYRQAGTICYTWDEFRELEQGKAILSSPIYELSRAAPSEPVSWPKATKHMALSGVKVLELTRIIAAPAVGKGLAEHGATVLRITSSTLPDLGILTPDLSQGKYNGDLNLKTEAGKATLRALLADADVFIDGYRPGCIERLGFSREEVRKINPKLVCVRENCYGWHGPWQGRSGWQQVSDCLTGASYAFGRALGLDEPVVPIFPNSDFGAGGSGIVGVMHALYLRATKVSESTARGEGWMS